MSVLVAARDEAQRLPATLRALHTAFPGASVWLADDGSRDLSGQIARRLGAQVVTQRRHAGKGEAMSAAAAVALAQDLRSPQPALFVLCDGDLGDSARALVALLGPVARGEADVTVGAFARRAGGGLGLTVGAARRTIRTCCGLETRAPLSGQRALSASALRTLLPFAAGYGMEVGMTIDAVRAGLRVRELELDLSHRATRRTIGGFAHRAAQLRDLMRAYRART